MKNLSYLNTNIKYFEKGNNDSLLINHGKKIIADRNSDIKHEGYAIITECLEKEKCIIAKGYNIEFDLPDNFDNLLYDPHEFRANVKESTIEFWKAEDKFGSKFIICRYKLNLFCRGFFGKFIKESDIWYYDLICYNKYDQEFYLLNNPYNTIIERDAELRQGYYEPYFTLIEKIKTARDIRRYILVCRNNKKKTITYYHKSSEINNTLNPNLVDFTEYDIIDNEKCLQDHIKYIRNLYSYGITSDYKIEIKCLDK